jgi:hypothetical protein
MHFSFSGIDWHKYALPAALLLVLFVCFFKLDTIIGAPKRRSGPQRPASGRDQHGRSFYSDPDGKPWKRRRKP